MHYTAVIITNRNYGLYGAFALGILKINTLVLDMSAPLPSNSDTYKIWEMETPEAYLECLKKINTCILSVKRVMYNCGENGGVATITASTQEDNKGIINITCSYLIFALDAHHPLLPSLQVTIENLSFQKNCYVIGEKALYASKIFMGDIFTGEANLVAQAIYNHIHGTNDSISIHSTSLH